MRCIQDGDAERLQQDSEQSHVRAAHRFISGIGAQRRVERSRIGYRAARIA
jgi:hypothetical protein